MEQAWFDVNWFGGLLGAGFGCMAGLWGCAASIMSPRGKHRRFVLAWGWSIAVLAIICLPMAFIAYFAGQPYGVWYGFGLVGVLGVIICPVQIRAVGKAYSEWESKRIQIEDSF